MRKAIINRYLSSRFSFGISKDQISQRPCDNLLSTTWYSSSLPAYHVHGSAILVSRGRQPHFKSLFMQLDSREDPSHFMLNHPLKSLYGVMQPSPSQRQIFTHELSNSNNIMRTLASTPPSIIVVKLRPPNGRLPSTPRYD